MAKATICPTVMGSTEEEYRSQIQTVTEFATRIHIDLADGDLAPTKLIAIDKVWWPGGVRADLHVMYRRPMEHIAELIALAPQLIIAHAEAEGDFALFAEALHNRGIEVGVALQAKTPVDVIQNALYLIDHVLIFSGDLGHFGGTADLKLLEKVKTLKHLKPQLEIGWDGGVNAQNARQLAESGIDVLNIGGFIHNSPNPQNSYQKLVFELK